MYPERPQYLHIKNGEKSKLPFSNNEYQNRLRNLRDTMTRMEVSAVLLTSMHNIAYYSGFLFCSFGRPYACVVTQSECVTVSANIDAGQPWRRSIEDNITYTDWGKDNYWTTIKHVMGTAKCVGIESDHVNLAFYEKFKSIFPESQVADISVDCMQQRMFKSEAEIELITQGARVADVGGVAIREAIAPGTSELEISIQGRDAMEREIAAICPDAEYRDTWVWFQSGLNTDGAHNPVTSRKVEAGDILSLNTFPMISGYYTALERTLFSKYVDDHSLKYWQANVKAHELGLSIIRPGISCASICEKINQLFIEEDVLQYRSFGYGHSFGLLSHYYGREAGLEIREDNHTVLQSGMVVSMEPMLSIPESLTGAGGYREHDILLVTEEGAKNITGFPYGPEHNIVV